MRAEHIQPKVYIIRPFSSASAKLTDSRTMRLGVLVTRFVKQTLARPSSSLTSTAKSMIFVRRYGATS